MSAVPEIVAREHDVAIVLLGTGVVGSALLRLLATPAARSIRLVGVANSTRQSADAHGFSPEAAARELHAALPHRDDAALLTALDASGASHRIVVDATASCETASRHAAWLDAGYDVVTANKAASAGPAWRDLRIGRYGDAATVGAGLPVLSTLRRLDACGDRLVALEGVLSGSLSWLFNHYDGSRPFSALLREARAWGYCEPDPRADLCGLDAARKLVILARAAGHAIDLDDVAVDNLVPEALRDAGVETFLARLDELDAPLAARHAEAKAGGRVLRHVGSLDAGGRARVGLVEVSPAHPAAHLDGTDNLFALTTQRYRARPLVIQGPGAGPEVTAQALLGDVLELR